MRYIRSGVTNKPLKILLLVPMNRRYQRGITVPDFNDTGLGYIAAACKKASADVTLLSWNVNWSIETFRQKLLKFRPDVLGLKVFTTMFRESYDTLRCVRETLPDAITVIGGPHPSTSRPEDIFLEFDELLDFAIAGDGEHGIVELAKQISAAGGKPRPEALTAIPGLIYRNGPRVFCNERYLDAELDTLAPMDWSIQQPAWFNSSQHTKNSNRVALIMDSRGCPAKCAFCCSSEINGSRPRHRSLRSLCAEIKELAHKYGVRELVFTGNAFLSDVEYVEELCRWLMSFEIPLKWSCTGAAYDRKLRDPKLLGLMRKAGCHLIWFGIESGNQDVRKRLCQPLSLEECTEVVNLTAESGIHADCYFMFGFPDETTEQIEDTIKYALSLWCYSTKFCICLPLPGTSSYNAVLKQQGIDRIDWNTYDFSNPNLLPCKASPRQVQHKLLKTKILQRSKLVRRLYRLMW